MGARQWYYADGPSQVGPVGENEFIQMFSAGRLNLNTMVWTQDMPEWLPASSIDWLMRLARPYPSAMPPPLGMAYGYESTTYAGFWKRFVAAFIDGIVLMVAGGIVGGVFGFGYGAVTGTAAGADAGGFIVGTLLGWFYSALLESSTLQATLGKMVLGIKVTDLNGQRVSFGRATGRHFAGFISMMILGIGYLMVAFTERKQGLHDIMAGCLVVNK